MREFVLIKIEDNSFMKTADGEKEFSRDEDGNLKVPDLTRKGWKWLPVADPIEGDENGWRFGKTEASRIIKPKPVYVPSKVRKLTIWLRMDDGEITKAEEMLDVMKVSAPRLRRLFIDAVEIDHNEKEFFPQLRGIFVQLYGLKRADALLEADI